MIILAVMSRYIYGICLIVLKIDKYKKIHNYFRQSQMLNRVSICIIILAIVIPGINGRICRQHCNCNSMNSRIDKIQTKLNQVSKENEQLLKKNIAIGSDFALQVSKDGNIYGYIYDEYKPSMTIPPDSQIQIIQKPIYTHTNYVRVFYDIGNKGLFTDLSVSGNYNASQISLPPRSISSISIPHGYQVILYAEDNFQGEHIVLTHSHDNLGKFNDRTQSIEIVKLFIKKPEHLAVIYSHPEHTGKQYGLVIGNNTVSSSQIKSVLIDPDYEVLIYSNDVLIDIIRSKEGIFGNSRRVQIVSPNTVFNVVVQKVSEHVDKYIVLYDDIDFKGPRFILKANATSSITHANGKLSSLYIHPEYEVILYEKTNFEGTYVVVSADTNNLNFYAFNDRAMSILIRPKNSKECVENVVIYSKPNYMGESMIVPIGKSECGVNNLLDFCDNIYAGSIKVPLGFKVTIIKKSIPIILNERVYTYTNDTSNIISFMDTLITSVIVEKV